jgi:rod shape-determining protein MreB
VPNHDVAVAYELSRCLAKLASLKDLRPPNEPLSGYSLPDANFLDSCVERLTAAGRDVLLYEADDLRSRIALPTLAGELQNQEHLAIYFRISELRGTLQGLCEAAVEAGYRNSMVVMVPTVEVGEELRDIKAALADISRDVDALRREAANPDVGGLTLNLGPLGVDLKSMRVLVTALTNYVARTRTEIDAGFIWSVTSELERLSVRVSLEAENAARALSETIAGVLAGLLQRCTLLASRGRDIWSRAMAFEARPKPSSHSARGLRAFRGFDLAVDFGSANTRIYLKGKGLVLDEPTVVCIRDAGRRRVLHAIGKEAREMIGRTPGHMEIIRPVRAGQISDFEVAELMLRHFIREAHGRARFVNPKVLIGVPGDIGVVQRRLLGDVFLNAAARSQSTLDAPLAAALGAQMPIMSGGAFMLVDVGAAIAQVSVCTSAGLVACRTVRVGGEQFDATIIAAVRQHANMLIDELSAERIKIELAGLSTTDTSERMIRVRGQDLTLARPSTTEVLAEKIRASLAAPIGDIAQAIRGVRDSLHPELMASIEGITLTGGGARSPGLSDALRDLTGIFTTVANEPATAIIRGMGRAISEPDVLPASL